MTRTGILARLAFERRLTDEVGPLDVPPAAELGTGHRPAVTQSTGITAPSPAPDGSRRFRRGQFESEDHVGQPDPRIHPR